MSFEALKETLADLAKAQSLEDTEANAKVAAAAEEGKQASGEAGNGEAGAATETGAAGAAAGEGEGAGKGGNPEDLEDPEAGKEATPMVKSFTLQLEGGEEIEAVDATEMLKSFGDQLEAVQAGAKSMETEIVGIVGGALDVIKAQAATIANLQKSFADQGELLAKQNATVAEQADLIKSFRDDLDAIRNSGGGRKSVTNPGEVSADSPLAKSLQNGDGEGLKPTEFLAKCLHLQKDGKLSLADVCTAEAAIGHGTAVPQHIVSTVFSHVK